MILGVTEHIRIVAQFEHIFDFVIRDKNPISRAVEWKRLAQIGLPEVDSNRVMDRRTLSGRMNSTSSFCLRDPILLSDARQSIQLCVFSSRSVRQNKIKAVKE